MFIRVIIAVFMLALATVGIAGAWGLPAALSPSTSSSADPDDFLLRARKAEALTGRSADSLFKAVASKEEQAKMEELQKKLNETTDDKEKNALRQQITESELAVIEKKAKDKQVQEDAKKWDEKKKRYVGNAFYNLTLGSLQAALLVPEGAKIVSSIQSNPVNAARLALKLNSVIAAGKSLSGIVTNVANVSGSMKPLMSAANIEAKAPSSATEAPKDASDQI